MVKLLHLSSSIKNGCKVSETIVYWQGTTPTGGGTGQLSQGTGGGGGEEKAPRSRTQGPLLCILLAFASP